MDNLQGLSKSAKETVLKNFEGLATNVYEYEAVKDDTTRMIQQKLKLQLG